MWYFTPKSDLLFLERFKAITGEFIAARAAVASMESFSGSHPSCPQAKEYAACVEKRDKLRTQFSQPQVKAVRLAGKYKVPVVFAVWVLTVNMAMQQFQLDAYAAVTEKTLPEEAEPRAIDTIDRCIGACKDQKREDFWHLLNPFYWIYACFHSLFTSSGLSKSLGESVTKLLSKALTAGIVAATPWLKQFAELWLKRLIS